VFRKTLNKSISRIERIENKLQVGHGAGREGPLCETVYERIQSLFRIVTQSSINSGMDFAWRRLRYRYNLKNFVWWAGAPMKLTCKPAYWVCTKKRSQLCCSRPTVNLIGAKRKCCTRFENTPLLTRHFTFLPLRNAFTLALPWHRRGRTQ
jgi:hypothetical protein